MALMKFREQNQVKWVGVKPAHNGEQVIESGGAVNATVILYTVPAGKTLFLSASNVTFFANAQADAHMGIYDGTPALSKYLWQLVGAAWANVFGCGIPYNPPIEVPAGYSIRLVSVNNNMRIYGTIHGWVE